ncbi:hypothetical protein [Flindersiella endophytica]
MAEEQEKRWRWFFVEDDTLPDDQITGEEPEMTGAPAAFIERLRDLISTWKTLGLTSDDTGAAYDGTKVWIRAHVGDSQGRVSLGDLRVDVNDTEWIAGWATADVLTYHEFADSLPAEQTGGPITDIGKGVDEAVSWLQEQLTRPVVRREWRRGGEVVARSWRLEDTGRVIVVSGDPGFRSNPDTADAAVQVRP